MYTYPKTVCQLSFTNEFSAELMMRININQVKVQTTITSQAPQTLYDVIFKTKFCSFFTLNQHFCADFHSTLNRYVHQ